MTSIGFFTLHLQILTDHLITLSLAASLYFLLRWQEEPSFKWAGPFFLALGLGFLSKGFIGLVFPLLIGGLYAWQLRQTSLLSLFWSPGGLALLILPPGPLVRGLGAGQPGIHQVPDRQ